MSRVKFKINGKEYSVGCEERRDTSLLQFVRDTLQLCGTKHMCREAGCGACIVGAASPGAPLHAVNSCVVPIHSCHGWEITTIEKVGNSKDGFDPIQCKFADNHATQCGYCTPGWIMSLYCLLKSGKKLTMLEMEQSFGSNICRCTGYRPILDVVKTYASDHPSKNNIQNNLPDIEDLKLCVNKNKDDCFKESCEEQDWCHISGDHDDVIKICWPDNKKWFLVKYVYDIFQILREEGTDSYMLIHGNTAIVPYPKKKLPDIIIHISQVEELKTSVIYQNWIVGGGVTISKFLEMCDDMVNKDSYRYLKKMADHFKMVAHIPVRNLGSIAGNLMIKHEHNEFPSDIFLLFDAVGAVLTVLSDGGSKQIVTMQEFLKTNMKGKVLYNVRLPPLNDDECQLVTFKIMARAQSFHGTVIVACFYKLREGNVVCDCRIAYGNISPTFTRAFNTEKSLIGKNLFNNATLKSTLPVLRNELKAVDMPPEASPECRKQLALNLFFKGLLVLCPTSLMNTRVWSGAIDIRASRPVSKASQSYDTNKALWPINQPLQKMEAKLQTSGQIQYTDDIPTIAHEAYLSYVTTSVATGIITNIDASKALACKLVIAFYSAKDLVGENTFTDPNTLPYTSTEEIFCDGNVKYFNQPVGVIVAETQKVADEASELVNITYANVKPPVIDIKDAIKDPKRLVFYKSKAADEKGNDIVKVIKHEDTIYWQYHFPMETIVCLARPTEDILEVFCTTQWPDSAQLMISKALKMDLNKIVVHARSQGGGFGMKISRTNMVAIACCYAAAELNRPCRFGLSMITNTRCIGKRLPCKSKWEVGVNSCGVIQYLILNMYEDNGYKINEDFYLLGYDMINNCYDNKRWEYNCYNVITDTASNTWCRGPGTVESIAMIELLMNQISLQMRLDPIAVRLANLDPQHEKLRQILDFVKQVSNYDNIKIEVEKFNAENKYKKQGLGIVPLRWGLVPLPAMEVTVSVYHGDGTVDVMHGGVEIGQGINTKAAQVCASLLDIPVEKVKVKCTNTVSSPNSSVTGGSLTSQNVCYGVRICCQKLLDALVPIKAKLQNPTWQDVITNAYNSEVSLVAHGSYRMQDFDPYTVYGATVARIQLDTLTAEFNIISVDLVEDVGQSVNPCIDIGQIEGALIMGQGYWTCEKTVFASTGELLTDRAWNYPVPQALDIPQKLNVYLLKNSYSNDAAFGSKCTGEPPICMSVAISIAIIQAITSGRFENGISREKHFCTDGPYCLEAICKLLGNKIDSLSF